MNSNKSFLIGKLIALLLLLAVIVTLGVYFITGNKTRLPLAWNFNTRSEENLILSEEYSGVDAINVNTASFSVRVEKYSGEKVKVEFYCTDKDGKDYIKLTQDASSLSVNQKTNSEFFSVYNASVVVLVPQDSAYDYSINTASGSIRLEAASGNVDIGSASGSVRVSDGGEKLGVTTVSGSIRVSGAFITANLNSTSGSIRAMADEKSESLDANSVSGSIKIMLDGANDYAFDCSSTSGSIRDEYTGSRYGSYGNGKVGAGTLKVSAHSTSGSIRLEDWND